MAHFGTPALGMSSFNFTPQPNQRYQASVRLPDGETATYPLPAVQQSGWALNVREIGNSYRVFVRHRSTARPRPHPCSCWPTCGGRWCTRARA